jgi:hypothetical protein
VDQVHPLELRVGVPQAEGGPVPVPVRGEEVPLDEGAHLRRAGRGAHLEVEAAGVGGEGGARALAGRLVAGLHRDRVGQEAIVGSEVIEREHSRGADAAAEFHRRVRAGDADRPGKIPRRDHVRRELGDLLRVLLHSLQTLLQRLLRLGAGDLRDQVVEPLLQRVELRLQVGEELRLGGDDFVLRSALALLLREACFGLLELRLLPGDLLLLRLDELALLLEEGRELCQGRLRRRFGLHALLRHRGAGRPLLRRRDAHRQQGRGQGEDRGGSHRGGEDGGGGAGTGMSCSAAPQPPPSEVYRLTIDCRRARRAWDADSSASNAVVCWMSTSR